MSASRHATTDKALDSSASPMTLHWPVLAVTAAALGLPFSLPLGCCTIVLFAATAVLGSAAAETSAALGTAPLGIAAGHHAVITT